MNRRIKKVIVLFLSVLLFSNCFTYKIINAEDNNKIKEKTSGSGYLDGVINPSYEEYYSLDDFKRSDKNISLDNLAEPQALVEGYYETIAEAKEYLKDEMLGYAHSAVVQFIAYDTDLSFLDDANLKVQRIQEIFYELIYDAIYLDDYLHGTFKSANDIKYGYRVKDGQLYLKFTIGDIRYFLDYGQESAQEAELVEELDLIIESLDLDQLSEYEKALAINDWMCENVDYDNLEDKTYLLKHTAYAAIRDGKAVCQGYALLFYRLAKLADLNAHYIPGESGDVGHAWNTVQIEGIYYLVDTTWNDTYYEHGYEGLNQPYFLKGSNTFASDHTPDFPYDNTVSLYDYVLNNNVYTVKYVDGVNGQAFVTQEYNNIAHGKPTPKFEGNISRTGYNFTSWNPALEKYVTENKTYTANWQAIRYTITYAYNIDGTVVTTTPGAIVMPNPDLPTSYTVENLPITLKTISATGYTFKGWTITGATPPISAGSATIPVGTTGNLTATARLTSIVYKINYDLAGGTVSGNPTAYTIGVPTFTLINPTRTGYDFKGWTGTDLNGPTMKVTIEKGSYGNRSYTATWSPTVYKIYIGSNLYRTYTIETSTFTISNPTKTGYTFKGWSGTGISGTTLTLTIVQGSTGDRTYTQNWTPVEYSISYNLAGGTVSGNPKSYNIQTTTFTLNNPTKSGHIFKGWTGTDLNESTMKVTIEKGSYGNRSYVATYEPIIIQSLTLNKDKLELKVDGEFTLVATILPEDANDKSLTWTSSNESVATVVDGKVKALKVGTTVIKAKTNDGSELEATCNITVKAKNLAQPKLVAIYNSANGADIRFKAVENATHYVIMRKFDGKWSAIKTIKASDLEKAGGNYKYIDETIKNNYGKGYIYSVAAKNNKETSKYDLKGLALYRLKQPTITNIASNKKGQVTLTWSKEDCHGYEVQYSSDNGKTWTKANETKETSLTINNLKSNSQYAFRIRCQKTNPNRGVGWSPYSSWKVTKVK